MQNKELIIRKIKDALDHITEYDMIDFDIENISERPNDFTIQINVSRSDEASKKMTQLSKRYGFTQNIQNMEFKHPVHGKMRVVTFKPRNRKYPVICECVSDGKLYKFTAEHVKISLGGDKAINRKKNLERLKENF